jgi:hypothetical protein
VRKFLLSLILCSAATPAAAQIHVESPNPGPDVPSGDVYIPGQAAENLNAKKVREGMVKFAKCIARRHPKEASDFVSDDSEAAWNALDKKIEDDCALEAVDNPGDEVRVSSNSRDLLFALAEVLVQKNLSTYDPAQIPAAAPLRGPSSIGECAVRANPQGASNLLKTRLNSKEELQAVQTLMPAFSGCIPAGTKVHPDLTTLRGNIAVYYYRLANAPKSPTATKSERGS